ncbi:hypothetical protein Tsubulata_023869 [Turnera subulata]|uniref:F-box domain-containing protein n=1 Tax=Turnera subulata TaxID=218843 RepID=A0A9Q0J1T1_9ROSI|nr:hypothetical protein Tsubulata_023869 [Turnera subulata]
MAATGNLSSSSLGSSKKRKRDERRVLVDEAKISTTTSTNNCHLPPEIVEEILSLLPSKSIRRFRSLSKSWSSLLVSLDFRQLRRRNSTPPPARILKLRCRYYGSECDPSNSPCHGFALSPYYPSKALRHTANTKESYPYQKFWVKRFVGSCNGLVCLEQTHTKPEVKKNHPKLEIVVWNPFMGYYRKLSDSMITWFDRSYAYGFGYDSASDDYKVFVATRRRSINGVRADIFSLKAGSWKEVKNPPRELRHLTRRDSRGLFLNGALHWESKNKKDGSRKIIAFDLAEEKFYDVPLPPSPLNYNYYGMGVVGEYLFVSFLTTTQLSLDPDHIVWVMKEYRNEASWVHLISYSPEQLTEAIYVPDSEPIISVKDGRNIWLQYFMGFVDVLEWTDNNPDGVSYEAEDQYSKRKVINFYRNKNLMAIPYTEALTSPYASTGIHPSRNF